MKQVKRILALAVSLLCILSVAAPPAYAGTSLSAITNDSINQKKNQISESENLKKELKSNISSAEKLKKQLESLKSDTRAYIEKLDVEITAIQEKIEELKRLISEKEVEIEVITKELNEAIAVQEAQYKAMKERIKFMYEKGDMLYLEIMLSAGNFSDFLTKADYIEQLETYDRMKLEEYTNTREYTELCKQTLESERDALNEAKAAQEAEETAINELMTEKENELSKYVSQIKQTESQIDDLEAELVEQTAIIESLEAAILAEQKAIAAANGVVLVYDGGKFTWPAPSYVAITDEFGWRTDPFTKTSAYHSGIDLGSAYGTPILAAYDGVVVAATYNASMGNYIMINHGDGLYTIYMHASSLLVKNDDIVARGEKIALVGSTGRSTGCHLHFGVRKDGAYVSPWPYLGVNK